MRGCSAGRPNRLYLWNKIRYTAHIRRSSSVAERFLGKKEVVSPILTFGSSRSVAKWAGMRYTGSFTFFSYGKVKSIRKSHTVAVFLVQAHHVLFAQEQENHGPQNRAVKILQILQEAYDAQGSEEALSVSIRTKRSLGSFCRSWFARRSVTVYTTNQEESRFGVRIPHGCL